MSVISARAHWLCLQTRFALSLTSSRILPPIIFANSLSFLHTLTSAAGKAKSCSVATCLGREQESTCSMPYPRCLRLHAPRPPVFSGMYLVPAIPLVLSETLRQACCTRMQRRGDQGRLQSRLSGRLFVGWQVQSDARDSAEASRLVVPRRILWVCVWLGKRRLQRTKLECEAG